MTRDELREKVARVLCREVMGVEYDVISESATYLERKTNPESAILDKQEAKEIADLVLDTIFAALKEPTDEMRERGYDAIGDETLNPTMLGMNQLWQAMLTASPLAPEGGKQ